MFKGTRSQVTLVMIILLIVAGGSALATLLGTRNHDKYHLAIDIINHQHELISRLSLLALSQTNHPELDPATRIFQQNLESLRFGGEAIPPNGKMVSIDRETDPAIRKRLDLSSDYWLAFRDDAIDVAELPVDHPQRIAAIESLQISTAQLVAHTDQLASAYDNQMQKELDDLRRWQIIFLLSTVLLLIFGIVTVRRRILRLDVLMGTLELAQNDQEIGNLSQEVYIDEVASLVDSFERIRPLITDAQNLLEERVLLRTRKLITAFEYSNEIVSLIDKNNILRQALSSAQSLVAAHSVFLCLIEDSGSILEVSAVDGQVAANVAFSPTHSANQPYQTIPIRPDVMQAEICQDCLFTKTCVDKNSLSVPLLADEKQIGSLCVANEPGLRFNEADREALQLFANSIAIAISNYRLTKTSREEEQWGIIKEERERLATVLHDNLAQTLSYINLTADRVSQMVVASIGNSDQTLDEIASMKTAASSAYDSVRGVLDDLNEGSLDQVNDTIDEIIDFISNYRVLTGLDVTLSMDKGTLARLSPVVQKQAMYIIRESLTNIFKHADATRVNVRLQEQLYGAELLIEDNGQGFDPLQEQEGTHLGLTIMQTRAHRCGGKLMIHSMPKQGTTVTAYFPYQETVTIHAN